MSLSPRGFRYELVGKQIRRSAHGVCVCRVCVCGVAGASWRGHVSRAPCPPGAAVSRGSPTAMGLSSAS